MQGQSRAHLTVVLGAVGTGKSGLLQVRNRDELGGKIGLIYHRSYIYIYVYTYCVYIYIYMYVLIHQYVIYIYIYICILIYI